VQQIQSRFQGQLTDLGSIVSVRICTLNEISAEIVHSVGLLGGLVARTLERPPNRSYSRRRALTGLDLPLDWTDQRTLHALKSDPRQG